MVGASAIFILDTKGKVIIFRNYRGDIPTNCTEKFVQNVVEQEDHLVKPVFSEDGVMYCWIRHRDVYLLSLSVGNSNAMLLMSFLFRLVDVLQDYFKTVAEESIRDNFVVTYELLDEVMDDGYPQTTEGKVLREYIKNEAFQMLLRDPGPSRPPACLTSAVSWRAEGIKHKKNEIFLDVIERLNLLVSSTGHVLRSEIRGSLLMKSYLSGMPELKLGLNDRLQFEAAGGTGSVPPRSKAVDLEDIRFHQCVRLSRFESDRIISFIPPDGEFELMSYRLSTQVKPLIWCQCTIKEPGNSKTRLDYNVVVNSNFKTRSIANDVEIHVPLPPDVDSPTFTTHIGSVNYIPDKNVMVWYIKQLQGQKKFVMAASFGLPSISSGEDYRLSLRRPILVFFEIPYFTVSSITVRYLKIIEKSGYQALPWVRYITKNGDYQLRMS